MVLPRTIPDRSVWHTLRPVMEPGELALAELLDDGLPPGWTIAVQTQLWNANPDVVVFNPDAGMAVFEVKDWSPEAREFEYSPEKKALLARSRQGRNWYVTRNPVDQVIGYREVAQSLFRATEMARRNVTAVVVMTVTPKNHQLFEYLRWLVPHHDRNVSDLFIFAGREVLENRCVEDLLPLAFKEHLQHKVSDRTVKRIESLLSEQESTLQQREPLTLDRREWELIRNPVKRRRVCGPAGSGKSVLLAASAAEAALAGKKVLVLVFNITMAHHLRDIAERYRPDGYTPQQISKAVKSNVTFFYIHEWCEDVCRDTGYGKRLRLLYFGGPGGLYPTAEIQGLLSEALKTRDWEEETETGPKLYDRVLIDEAQNIDAEWFELVVQVLRNDESDLMIAYDPTQSLYLSKPSWTDGAMSGAGFSGPPVSMEYSYRLPESVIPMLVDFCDTFLHGDPDVDLPVVDPDPQAELFPCRLLYRNVSGSGMLPREVAELVYGLPAKLGVHPGDVSFMLWTHEAGLETLEHLDALAKEDKDNNGDDVTSVFGPNHPMRKRLKKGFWPGSGEMKGSTVHSFQGWESPCVVLAVPQRPSPGSVDDEGTSVKNYWRLVYTGLTRVMNSERGSHLIVVNAERTFKKFLDKWFEELD